MGRAQEEQFIEMCVVIKLFMDYMFRQVLN